MARAAPLRGASSAAAASRRPPARPCFRSSSAAPRRRVRAAAGGGSREVRALALATAKQDTSRIPRSQLPLLLLLPRARPAHSHRGARDTATRAPSTPPLVRGGGGGCGPGAKWVAGGRPWRPATVGVCRARTRLLPPRAPWRGRAPRQPRAHLRAEGGGAARAWWGYGAASALAGWRWRGPPRSLARSCALNKMHLPAERRTN